jgi:hypothetical protein
MAEWVVSGGEVTFDPAPDWNWFEFAGRLTVSAPDRRLSCDGRPVVLFEDVKALERELEMKGYKAVGFADTAGRVSSASILVDGQTLDERLEQDGERIVLATTTGRFFVSCVPSMLATAPPTPDLQAALHRGTWRITAAGQERATTE